MSDQQFERAVLEWLEDGTDRTPERAIDGVLLAVKTTPQERGLRIPWRFPQVLAKTSATAGIAAVALVAVVGLGGMIYLNNRPSGGVGAQSTPPPASQAPTPTVAPTPEPTPEPSEGVLWVPYTSEVYGYTFDHPAGWDFLPASRPWEPGDDPENALLFADQFSSEADDAAFGVFRAPAGPGVDAATVDGLKAFAVTYCEGQALQGVADCDTFAEDAVSLCLDIGDGPCMSAIVIPSRNVDNGEEGTYAFVSDGSAENVVVFAAYRGEGWPGTAKYGGTSALLTSVMESLILPDAP